MEYPEDRSLDATAEKSFFALSIIYILAEPYCLTSSLYVTTPYLKPPDRILLLRSGVTPDFLDTVKGSRTPGTRLVCSCQVLSVERRGYNLQTILVKALEPFQRCHSLLDRRSPS